MNWESIVETILDIIQDIREKSVIDNIAIRDSIFNILESMCTVIYYPLDEEKNRGFHIKKIVNDKLEDFVYINTAKPMSEQIFTAAHELGHIWEVAQKVWNKLGYQDTLNTEIEEDITNRFAAEFLMPHQEFRDAFFSHMDEIGIKSGHVKLEDLIRVIVLQMGDFMVPYEAVKLRLFETHIMKKETIEFLDSKENEIYELVTIYTKDQNTFLSHKTGSKTISGLRTLLDKAEKDNECNEYVLNKIKREFELVERQVDDELVEIHMEDNCDE